MSAAVLAILDSDLKATQPALHKARQVADSTKAPLHVLVNAYSSAMVRAVGVDQQRQDAARTQIHKAWQKRIGELTDRDSCELSILWHKDSMAALRESILDLQPAMVVVHTSEESGLRRHLFTPRDWQLIRKAPCPVLCVHGRQWSPSPRILAALDPGSEELANDPLAIEVLDAAGQFSSKLGGTLRACHVLDEMDDSLILLVGEAIPDYSGGMDKVREFYRERFLQFGAAHGLGPDQMAILSGPVAPTLARYCDEQKMDVLVVGTVHRNLPERLLLGATAESVITRASTDVLVIKPDGFQSPWQA
ncbi:universal stress protein [uncultured Alcanivorax sp.]|uniref:universal stress protein n=1 Tax=uncultured Alcanivorax sp. TaxID=191215 RepID=UPI0026142251|nr:universal stress protein [uncultured Alcanivorax sp.]